MKFGLNRAAVLAASVWLSACASNNNPYYDPSKPHHRPNGFVNTDGSIVAKSREDVLRWYRERFGKTLPPPPSQVYAGYEAFPVHPFKADALTSHGPRSATWLGHATVLLNVDGLTVLTDPHFSPRAFPIQAFGPFKRKVPSPAQVADLPPVNVVVISHNHYDHLDEDTVRALAARNPDTLFLVPLGVERLLKSWDINNVQALDWWQSIDVKGAKFSFVPAYHWSTRIYIDRNESLWGGWVMEHPALKFYFTGDTGYGSDFKEIGRRYGPFDLSAIAVGAYEPRWFMKEQHINPDEAVKIHQDVGSKQSLGVHWGTFELTDEALDQPIVDMRKALAEQGIAGEKFRLLEHGQTMRLP